MWAGCAPVLFGGERPALPVQALHLRNNELRRLPVELGACGRLRLVESGGNPQLQFPHARICAHSLAEMLGFLKRIHAAKTQPTLSLANFFIDEESPDCRRRSPRSANALTWDWPPSPSPPPHTHTSAQGPGSPRIRTGTWLTPPTSARGLGPPRPHLHRDLA